MDFVVASLKVVRVGIGNVNEVLLEREWSELDSRSLVKLVLEFDPAEATVVWRLIFTSNRNNYTALKYSANVEQYSFTYSLYRYIRSQTV